MYYPCEVLGMVVENVPETTNLDAIIEYRPKGSIFPQTYKTTLRWYPENKTIVENPTLPNRGGHIFRYKDPFPWSWRMAEIWDFVVAMHNKSIIPDDYFQWFKEVVEKEVNI